jgi:hypothetical protein
MPSTLPNEAKQRELWRQLVTEGLTYNSETNTTRPFGLMSKRFGRAWIDYIQAAWEARDELSDEEFCRLNGDVPLTFIEKNLRSHTDR